MHVEKSMSREAYGIDSREPVRQAAQMMLDQEVSVLPVFEDGEPVGMITDRDITVRLAAAGLDPDRTPVAAVMTADRSIVPWP